MTDAFNMVPVLIRPINEIEGEWKYPLNREEVEACWNCGGILQYVENVRGLVIFDKDTKPIIIPVEQNFYCAQCGKHQKSWSNSEDKDTIMKFEDASEARDAEFLLSMKENAVTYKNWSEDRYNELMKKIDEFKKKRWDKDGS